MMIDINLLLAYGAAYKKLSKGEPIFSEGSNCAFYYQLVSGRVHWLNLNEQGEEFIQIIIDPGESFGELSLFDDEPYGESAVAGEDSTVIRLCKPIFHELLKRNPDIHFNFSRLMAERMRIKFMLLQACASHQPIVRIKTLLNYFKQKNKKIFSKSSQLNLTRQQIANMTGLRVETVIRTIRQMHDSGHLLIKKGKVFY